MSRRKEEYATASYEIALHGSQIIPPVLNMTAWNNDLVLLSQLTTIHRQLAQLQEGLGDTILALRAETALQSNTLFDILKALAKQNTLGADTMVEKLQKLKIKTRNKEK